MTTLKDRFKLQCFLITSQRPEDSKLSLLLRQMLMKSGFQVSSAWNTKAVGLPEGIHEKIESSDIVVANLAKTNNPNVMYELGFAYGVGKIVLPIFSAGAYFELTSLSTSRFLIYDPQRVAEFKEALQGWIDRYLEERNKFPVRPIENQ